MGTCSSGKGGTGSGGGLTIGSINANSAGANFRKLPQVFKDNIEKQMRPGDLVVHNWQNGNRNNMTTEWTAGLTGVKDKRKVIMSYDGSKITYTIKNKNKIELKTTNRNQAANKIAEFYNQHI